MTSNSSNQGEGDKASAKRYNQKAEEFVSNNAEKISEEAQSAKTKLQQDGAVEELTDAEKKARSRAKELDPAVSKHS